MAALTLAIVLAPGCGDSGTEDETEPAWAEMDASQRRDYMVEVVYPRMREIFVAYDPERYADFSCESCHGPDAEASGWAMPAFLEALPLDGTLEAVEALNPEQTSFMLDEVFPEFVELLGETKYATDNPEGYRCTGCHLVDE